MITFRSIEPRDLDGIYSNEVLRPLITISGRGEMFAVVAEEDGGIKGGISGYRQGDDAFVQQVAVMPGPDKYSLMDGLIRSLIYILDIEGVKRLFVADHENSSLYRRIGFKRFEGKDTGCGLVLDISLFFGQKPCR